MDQAFATRRGALAAGLALPWAARRAQAQAQVNVVLESEVVILDPHATTAAITRTFATHVFDTLFAMDGQGAIRPQMVEAWERSSDGLLWDFRLRPGLRGTTAEPRRRPTASPAWSAGRRATRSGACCGPPKPGSPRPTRAASD